MPQLHTMSSDHDKPIILGKPDDPICPACHCAMTVRTVTPSTSMIGVGDTVYVCERCGTETHRTARRQ